ncbi:MAG: winged helix-turn-helix domain-containing protein [Alphaproteobacteria bacterium]|nr:winged helix-turn-helix domain-containing protein [Alphaproteobacteria bacterium]
MNNKINFQQKKILVFDPYQKISLLIVEHLGLYPEFDVNEVEKIDHALDMLKHGHYDHVFVHAETLNDISLDFCKLAYKEFPNIFIILIADSKIYKNLNPFLVSGVRYFLDKPFHINQLIALLKEQNLTHADTSYPALSIGPYDFYPHLKLLLHKKNKKEIRLTEKESAILRFLYDHEGIAMDRETLLDKVWGYNSGVSTRTLETHMYRLRQKIELNPIEASILITEEKGYRLVS